MLPFLSHDGIGLKSLGLVMIKPSKVRRMSWEEEVSGDARPKDVRVAAPGGDPAFR